MRTIPALPSSFSNFLLPTPPLLVEITFFRHVADSIMNIQPLVQSCATLHFANHLHIEPTPQRCKQHRRLPHFDPSAEPDRVSTASHTGAIVRHHPHASLHLPTPTIQPSNPSTIPADGHFADKQIRNLPKRAIYLTLEPSILTIPSLAFNQRSVRLPLQLWTTPSASPSLQPLPNLHPMDDSTLLSQAPAFLAPSFLHDAYPQWFRHNVTHCCTLINSFHLRWTTLSPTRTVNSAYPRSCTVNSAPRSRVNMPVQS